MDGGYCRRVPVWRLRSPMAAHRAGATAPPLLRYNVPSSLFDQLIGAGEQGRRYDEAERLRGFEIDDELESSGLLDR